MYVCRNVYIHAEVSLRESRDMACVSQYVFIPPLPRNYPSHDRVTHVWRDFFTCSYATQSYKSSVFYITNVKPMTQ